MSLLDVTLSTGYREWMERAYCRQMPPELWYGDGQEDAALAKKLCRTECPVIRECLKHALGTQEQFGIWGGTGPHERRKALGLPAGLPACEKNHPGYPPEIRRRGGTGYVQCNVCARVKDAERAARKKEEAA